MDLGHSRLIKNSIPFIITMKFVDAVVAALLASLSQAEGKNALRKAVSAKSLFFRNLFGINVILAVAVFPLTFRVLLFFPSD